MAKKKKQLPRCCSPTKLDHPFGPRDSSSAVFASIFPPSSTVGGRDSRTEGAGCKGIGTQGNEGKGGESNSQNETVESSYYSSSIYYGGQENYSRTGRGTTQSYPVVLKKDDDASPNSASRGNWWQGSLYY